MRWYQQKISFHKNNLGSAYNSCWTLRFACGKPLVEHLRGGKFLVERSALEKLLVGAGADYLARLHHDDLVGVDNRGQAVGDDDYRAIFGNRV